MVASMDPNKGRLGVVMPHGVLFRGGVEGRIRQCLIENDQLEAVIGLPSNLFYSTSIPACILVFRAKKDVARKGTVLFVDGSARFSKGKNQNTMDAADVEAVIQAYRSGEDSVGRDGVQVMPVAHADIKENAWDLNIGRYIKTGVGELTDVPTTLVALAEAQVALRNAEERLAERLKAAGYA
jgi:type I restriction enzyme M protein